MIIGNVQKRAGIAFVVLMSYLLGMRFLNRRQMVLLKYRVNLLPCSPVYIITCYNGEEFANYETVNQALNDEIHFAQPFGTWKRASNTNTNTIGLIYLNIFKGFTLIRQTKVDILITENWPNSRPMKCITFNKLIVRLKTHCCT